MNHVELELSLMIGTAHQILFGW